MLGILCFLIGRIKPKMGHIYAQVNLLNSIEDEEIGHEFGAGMYMLTCLNAAFLFLRTAFLDEI